MALTGNSPARERDSLDETEISELGLGKPHAPSQQKLTTDVMNLHPPTIIKTKGWKSERGTKWDRRI